MARTATPHFSASQNALENFETLRKYALSGTRKVQSLARDEGRNITIIKDGHIVEVEPNGNENRVSRVDSDDAFEPFGLSQS